MKKIKTVIFISMLQLAFLFQKVFHRYFVLRAGLLKLISLLQRIFMGGYDESLPNRHRRAYGKIYIRTLAFDDSINRVVFIEADLCSFLLGIMDLLGS
jgi:hypothetical protein